jgi:hypothetical protein
MCGALVRVPVGTLGISSTDFDLKTHIHPQRSPCKPASTLLPVASSLQHPYAYVQYNFKEDFFIVWAKTTFGELLSLFVSVNNDFFNFCCFDT